MDNNTDIKIYGKFVNRTDDVLADVEQIYDKNYQLIHVTPTNEYGPSQYEINRDLRQDMEAGRSNIDVEVAARKKGDADEAARATAAENALDDKIDNMRHVVTFKPSPIVTCAKDRVVLTANFDELLDGNTVQRDLIFIIPAATQGTSGILSAEDKDNMDAAIAKVNNTNVQKIVDERIDDLVNGAPTAYDTLKEIADYIQSDKDAGSALTRSIQEEKTRATDAEKALDNKIDNLVYVHDITGECNESEVDLHVEMHNAGQTNQIRTVSISPANEDAAGVMTAADKKKLDSIDVDKSISNMTYVKELNSLSRNADGDITLHYTSHLGVTGDATTDLTVKGKQPIELPSNWATAKYPDIYNQIKIGDLVKLTYDDNSTSKDGTIGIGNSYTQLYTITEFLDDGVKGPNLPGRRYIGTVITWHTNQHTDLPIISTLTIDNQGTITRTEDKLALYTAPTTTDADA